MAKAAAVMTMQNRKELTYVPRFENLNTFYFFVVLTLVPTISFPCIS